MQKERTQKVESDLNEIGIFMFLTLVIFFVAIGMPTLINTSPSIGYEGIDFTPVTTMYQEAYAYEDKINILTSYYFNPVLTPALLVMPTTLDNLPPPDPLQYFELKYSQGVDIEFEFIEYDQFRELLTPNLEKLDFLPPIKQEIKKLLEYEILPQAFADHGASHTYPDPVLYLDFEDQNLNSELITNLGTFGSPANCVLKHETTGNFSTTVIKNSTGLIGNSLIINGSSTIGTEIRCGLDNLSNKDSLWRFLHTADNDPAGFGANLTSINLWVLGDFNVGTSANRKHIVSTTASNDGFVFMARDPDELVGKVSERNQNEVFNIGTASQKIPNDGAWHMITMLVNKTQQSTNVMRLCLDSTICTNHPYLSSPRFDGDGTGTFSRFTIGENDGTSVFAPDFNVDEVAVWKNHFLNSSEIDFLFNGGVGNRVLSVVSTNQTLSDVAVVVDQVNTTLISPPDQVTGLFGNYTLDNTEVRLTWTEPSSVQPILNYSIFRQGAGAFIFQGNSTTINFTNNIDTIFPRIDTTIQNFNYTISAISTNGAGENSTIFLVKFRPDKPTSLVPTRFNETQIDLSWVAPTGTIIGYKIDRASTFTNIESFENYTNFQDVNRQFDSKGWISWERPLSGFSLGIIKTAYRIEDTNATDGTNGLNLFSNLQRVGGTSASATGGLGFYEIDPENTAFSVNMSGNHAFGGGIEDGTGGTNWVMVEWNLNNGTTLTKLMQTATGEEGLGQCPDDDPFPAYAFGGYPECTSPATFQPTLRWSNGTTFAQGSGAVDDFVTNAGQGTLVLGEIDIVSLDVKTEFNTLFPSDDYDTNVDSWDLIFGVSGSTSQTGQEKRRHIGGQIVIDEVVFTGGNPVPIWQTLVNDTGTASTTFSDTSAPPSTQTVIYRVSAYANPSGLGLGSEEKGLGVTAFNVTNTDTATVSDQTDITAIITQTEIDIVTVGDDTEITTGKSNKDTATVSDQAQLSVATPISITDLRAYYKFDVTTGRLPNENIAEIFPQGNSTSETVASKNVVGLIGNAWQLLDGTTSTTKILIGGSNATEEWNFMSRGGSSVNVWIKGANNTANTGRIFDTEDVSDLNGAKLTWRNDVGLSRSEFTVKDGLSQVAEDSGDGFLSIDDEFHMYTMVRRGSTIEWLKDGVSFSNSTGASTSQFNTFTFPSLGGDRFTSLQPLANATIDEWSFWQRPLTQDEVTTLFNNGNGLALSQASPPPPTNVSSAEDGNNITITWTKESTADGYKILRKATNDTTSKVKGDDLPNDYLKLNDNPVGDVELGGNRIGSTVIINDATCGGAQPCGRAQNFTMGNQDFTLDKIRLKIIGTSWTGGNALLKVAVFNGSSASLNEILENSTDIFTSTVGSNPFPSGQFHDFEFDDFVLLANKTYMVGAFTNGSSIGGSIQMFRDDTVFGFTSYATNFDNGELVFENGGDLTAWSRFNQMNLQIDLIGDQFEEIATLGDVDTFTDVLSSEDEGNLFFYKIKSLTGSNEGSASSIVNQTAPLISGSDLFNSTSKIWQFREHDIELSILEGASGAGCLTNCGSGGLFPNANVTIGAQEGRTTATNGQPLPSDLLNINTGLSATGGDSESNDRGAGIIHFFKIFNTTEITDSSITIAWQQEANGGSSDVGLTSVATLAVFDGIINKDSGFNFAHDIPVLSNVDGVRTSLSGSTLSGIQGASVGAGVGDFNMTIQTLNASSINWGSFNSSFATVVVSMRDPDSEPVGSNSGAYELFIANITVSKIGTWNFTNPQIIYTVDGNRQLAVDVCPRRCMDLAKGFIGERGFVNTTIFALPTVPDQVTGLTVVQNMTNNAELDWNDVVDADNYQVFRGSEITWQLKEHNFHGSHTPSFSTFMDYGASVNNTFTISSSGSLVLHSVGSITNGHGYIYKSFQKSFLEGKDITLEHQTYCSGVSSCAGQRASLNVDDGSWEGNKATVFPDDTNRVNLGKGSIGSVTTTIPVNPSNGIQNMTILASANNFTDTLSIVTLNIFLPDGQTGIDAQTELYRLIIGNSTTGQTIFNFSNPNTNYTSVRSPPNANDNQAGSVSFGEPVTLIGSPVLSEFIDSTISPITNVLNYTVRANSIFGFGLNSTIVQFGLIQPIANLNATALNTTAIQLTWDLAQTVHPSDPLTGVIIQRANATGTELQEWQLKEQDLYRGSSPVNEPDYKVFYNVPFNGFPIHNFIDTRNSTEDLLVLHNGGNNVRQQRGDFYIFKVFDKVDLPTTGNITVTWGAYEQYNACGGVFPTPCQSGGNIPTPPTIDIRDGSLDRFNVTDFPSNPSTTFGTGDGVPTKGSGIFSSVGGGNHQRFETVANGGAYIHSNTTSYDLSSSVLDQITVALRTQDSDTSFEPATVLESIEIEDFGIWNFERGSGTNGTGDGILNYTAQLQSDGLGLMDDGSIIAQFTCTKTVGTCDFGAPVTLQGTGEINFTTIATVDELVTLFNDTGLDSNSLFLYRAKGQSAVSTGAFDIITNATTLAVAEFNQTATDTATVSDQTDITAIFNQTVTDTATVLDQTVVTAVINQTATDTATVSDQTDITSVFNQTAIDTAIVSDNVNATFIPAPIFNQSAIDTVTVSDQTDITSVFNQTATDTVTVVDDTEITTGKSNKDTATTSDQQIITSPPFPITTLVASTVGNTCELTWSAPFNGNSPIIKFQIFRSVAGGAFTLLLNQTFVNHTDTGLANLVTYEYNVTSINAFGDSEPSNIESCMPIVSNPPNEPTLLDANEIANGDVVLDWTEPTQGSPTGYLIERKIGGGGFAVLVANTGNSLVTFTDTTTTPDTTFTYRVAGINAFGTGAFSNEAVVKTASPPVAPLLSGAQNGNQIDISWTTPLSDNPINGYKIDRRINLGAFTTIVANTTTTLTTFTDNNVTKPNTYGYRVRALSSAGEGTVSNIVDIVFGSHIVVQVREQDGSGFKGGGTVKGVNSTFSLLVGLDTNSNAIFDNLAVGNFNFTFIDDDNFILNKTFNFPAPSGNLTSIFTINALVFDVDCPVNGVGTDIRIKVNYTDVKDITEFPSVPVCDSTEQVSWSTRWQGSAVNDTSTMIADFISTIFRANAEQFLASADVIPTVFNSGENQIESDTYVVNMTDVTINFNLFLGRAPSGGGGGGSGSQPTPQISIPDPDVVFADRLTGLSLLSRTHQFAQAGDVIEGSITVNWEGEQNLIVREIVAGDFMDIRFDELTPFPLDQRIEGIGEFAMSSAEITYTIILPPNECNPEIGLTQNCFDPILHTIPIEMEFGLGEQIYEASTEIFVDGRPIPIDIVQLQIILLFIVLIASAVFGNFIRRRFQKGRGRQRVAKKKFKKKFDSS